MQPLSDYFNVFLRGEERPGLFAYALGRSSPETLQAWRPDGGPWDWVSVDTWLYQGATIAMMQLGFGGRSIADDADEWRVVFRNVMAPAIELGAEVSWLGAEDSSWNPEVLRPGNSAGNVVAGMQGDATLVCDTEDARSVTFLNDECLAPIWHAASSLLKLDHDAPDREKG